uniref:Host cell surface-exposed lipoprotein n=1 Tax=Siphoviridae sp. ctHNg1 TaxID=2827828 RepID=A0A8S5TFL2_9CAUD|nr:MAG TPA: Host cell surface-exposed lipoprotein [Siphoviridae sp. ctHNg1]
MKKEKDSKPFYKKVWFWILVAILAISGSNALTKQTSSKADEEKASALKTAQELVESKASFSEKTLLWYLTESASHKYSKKAAQYAVENVGDVWVDEALDIAKEERSEGKTDQEILKSLTDKDAQFTEEQALKAIEKLNE